MRANGFTLIELMVVVVISMVLMGGAVVGINRYFAGEKLNSAASETESVLNLAKIMAVTNQSPAGFGGMDYVAVTISTDGIISVYPVNNSSGIGSSMVAKDLRNTRATFSQIDLGGLQFGAGSGKLLGKNAAPSFASYSLAANSSVGVTISLAEVAETRQLVISSLGEIKISKL